MKNFQKYAGMLLELCEINLKTGHLDLGWHQKDSNIVPVIKSLKIPIEVYVQNFDDKFDSRGDVLSKRDVNWKKAIIYVVLKPELLKLISALIDKNPKSNSSDALKSYVNYSADPNNLKKVDFSIKMNQAFVTEVKNPENISKEIVSAFKSFAEALSNENEKLSKVHKGSFFHVTKHEHDPGDIIEGNWKFGSDDDDAALGITMEDIEEEIEERRPEDAVSRKNAVFMFETYLDAVNYRDRVREGAKIYIVKPVGKKTRVDMRGVDAVQIALEDGNQKIVNKMIDRYWAGLPNSKGFPVMWEHICKKIKVIEEVVLKESNQPNDLLRKVITEMLNVMLVSKNSS